MKNITKQIKQALAVDTLGSVSDFFYFIETLANVGFEISYWKGEENCATLLKKGVVIGYIWQKYPLMFINEDYGDEITKFFKELNYIILIKTNDLTNQEFTINMDDDLMNSIDYGLETKSFSANDFWFHTVS